MTHEPELPLKPAEHQHADAEVEATAVVFECGPQTTHAVCPVVDFQLPNLQAVQAPPSYPAKHAQSDCAVLCAGLDEWMGHGDGLTEGDGQYELGGHWPEQDEEVKPCVEP